MADMKLLLNDLVTANHILANENVLDSFGHVSVRHPDKPGHFIMSRARAPQQCEMHDLMEFELDGKIVGPNPHPGKPYSERFIHGALYEARPEVMSVVHNHSVSVIPFSVVKSVKLKPLMHMAGPIGDDINVWDSATKFGDTNLLVVNPDQGRSLAKRLGPYSISLMRGHGFTAAGKTLIQALWMAVYLPVNAAVQSEASRLGPFKPLSKREIELGGALDPTSPAMLRSWEYWAKRAGCEALLKDD